jgi:hypothetical protein
MQQILSNDDSEDRENAGIKVLTSILLRADNVVERWAMSVIGTFETCPGCLFIGVDRK